MNLRVLLGIPIGLFCMAASGAATDGALRAGAAKSDISRVEEGLRINDPVYAKALVLEAGKTRAVIIAMDVTAIGGIGEVTDAFLPALRARIEAELAIPGKHVLVNASHNHPPLNFLCPPEELLARAFDAVQRAHAALEPVTAGAGSGHEDRISMNRTLRLKGGEAWTIRHTNPCPPDDTVEGLGPLDPEIGVLRLDRLDGSPLAVVYNFACHPYVTVPEGGVTADFPGFASEVIEENLPGAMALFLQGAGGDVTPILYKDPSRPRDSAPEGRLLGLSTLKAVRAIQTQPAELRVINEPLPLPRKADFAERTAALEAEQAELLKSLRGTSLNLKSFVPLYLRYSLDPEHPLDYSYRYLQSASIGHNELADIDAQNRAHLQKYVQNVRTMERLARIQDDIATLDRHRKINADSGETTVATEVQAIRIGDFVLVTSPAEVLTTVGLNVKNASPFEFTFMAAYSNGYIHYGPPASEYPAGGYEVTECLLAPEWQALYEAKSAEILGRLQ
ncbi:MAG: hypothetical protein HYV27_06960 [Candidatus Hydrogenedentes bacterium]|nr:hypothetical protein [Candidatus Hydrogenedentota bacterium]